MRTTFLAGMLAAALLGSAGEAAPPAFRPEPPEPAAAALVESYLGLLAAGRFDDALVLVDQRGMRQYLLDRRLAELKAKNPELTAQDLAELSAQLQVNELAPARLRDILLDVMRESTYQGLTWKILAFAPSTDIENGQLVRIEGRTTAGKEKPILLGLKKLGEQWVVAPEVVEALMATKPVIQVVPTVPTPPEVSALVETFWKHWQNGTPDEAYALMGAEYRDRVPLLVFLQEAQDAISRAGVPTAWRIVQSRELSPNVLGLGVNITGAKTGMQSVMVFKKTGATWVLSDAQHRIAAAGPDVTRTGPGPVQLRPDLRPDLKPDLAPSAFPAPAPAVPDPAGPKTN